MSNTSRVHDGLRLTVVGGLGFLGFLAYSAWVGVVACFVPALPLFLLVPAVWRQWVDFVGGSWLGLPTSLLELCGLKFVFSGDEFVSTDACIVASNHRNRLDWLFLWGLFVRYGRLQYHKIMLKAPLKHLPGPGWATQAMCFLFVERSWEKDEAYISSWIQYYQNQNYPLQLVMFPEGTDLSAGNLKRSHAFSEKSGLPVYEYVMHPRVKGFCSTVQQLRSTTDAVYDVTIGYPKGLPQNEKELAMGMFPGEVHIHVKRYLMMSIPDNEDDLGQWVKDRWADKEQRLKAFYAQARKDKLEGRAITSFGPSLQPKNTGQPTRTQNVLAWTIGSLLVTISACLNPLIMLYLVTVTVVLGVLSYMGVSLDKTTISRAKRFGAKKWT